MFPWAAGFLLFVLAPAYVSIQTTTRMDDLRPLTWMIFFIFFALLFVFLPVGSKYILDLEKTNRVDFLLFVLINSENFDTTLTQPGRCSPTGLRHSAFFS